MRHASTCLAVLHATIIGCGVGYPQEATPPEPSQDAAKEAATTLADNDTSWIAETKIAKRLVALGFVKQKDSYIYNARMPFGDFKKNFGTRSLRPSLSTGPGEWIRTTTIKGNHTVIRPRSH